MAEFKPCKKCSGKKKDLCSKFRTCLEPEGDKKPGTKSYKPRGK